MGEISLRREGEDGLDKKIRGEVAASTWVQRAIFGVAAASGIAFALGVGGHSGADLEEGVGVAAILVGQVARTYPAYTNSRRVRQYRDQHGVDPEALYNYLTSRPSSAVLRTTSHIPDFLRVVADGAIAGVGINLVNVAAQNILVHPVLSAAMGVAAVAIHAAANEIHPADRYIEGLKAVDSIRL